MSYRYFIVAHFKSPKSPSALDCSDFALNLSKDFSFIEFLLMLCDLFCKHALRNTKSVFSWKCPLVSFALSYTIPRGPYNLNHQQRRPGFHFLLRVPVSAPSRLSNIVLVSSLLVILFRWVAWLPGVFTPSLSPFLLWSEKNLPKDLWPYCSFLF